MTSEPIIITLDGLSACGKSSLAKGLARSLGFSCLNSGNLFRATAYLLLRAGADWADRNSVDRLLRSHELTLDWEDSKCVVRVDGTLLGADLEPPRISECASTIATYPEVRANFMEILRRSVRTPGTVAEGRDMGTVVFPRAHVRFFVTAPFEVRVRRRVYGYRSRNPDIAESEFPALFAATKLELAQRDSLDTKRRDGPAVPAKDAIMFCNSGMSRAASIRRMVELVNKALPSTS